MRLASALALGTAPALAWLWYFYRRDRHEPEPLRQVLKFFALGALVTIPAGLLNDLAGGWLTAAHVAVGVAPVVEEAGKFLVVLLLLRGLAECDEPVDGAIYGVSAALGFAALENATYVLRHGEGVIVGRSLFSTLGHGLFAVPWGTALGLQLCGLGHPLLTAGGLTAGIALHGTFNFLVGSGEPAGVAVFLLLAFPAFVLLARRVFRHSLGLSPFAGAPLCAACGEPVAMPARFCGSCGQAAPASWRCVACGAHAPVDRAFCGSCGLRRPASPAPAPPDLT